MNDTEVFEPQMSAWPALAFALSGVFAGCGGSGAEEVAERLQGQWRTGCVPVSTATDTLYSIYQYELEGTDGEFRFTLHADTGCAMRLLGFRNASETLVGEPLPSIESGTYELDVHFEALHMTPYTVEFADALANARCGSRGWFPGVEQDVTVTGCMNVRPLANCPADYDIIRFEEDRWFNGVRAGDLCTPQGRPTALNSYAFERVR